MSSARKIVLTTANVLVGILSYYLFICTLLGRLMGTGNSPSPLWSIAGSLLIFFVINIIIIRSNNLKPWLSAFGIAMASAVMFASIFAIS